MQESRSLVDRIFFSPEERRLRAGWRLLVQFIAWFILSILFSIPFAGILLQPDQQSPAFFLANGVVSALAATVSIYLARRWLDHRSFLDLGLHWNRRAVADISLGIGLTGVIFALIYTVEWGFGWLQFEGFAWESQAISAVARASLWMLLAYIFTGWGEELLFRGYWLQNLMEGTNVFWGVVISSLVFALVHLGNPNPSAEAVVGLTVGGLFFAYTYLRTRGLWLPVGIHIGWNLFEGTVFGFQVSGTQPFRLVEQSVSGPALVTGGAFGPEAGLIILPALLLGAVIVYVYTRNRQDRPAGGE
jgi:membrane protease YdiL (CAAX protease family)